MGRRGVMENPYVLSTWRQWLRDQIQIVLLLLIKPAFNSLNSQRDVDPKQSIEEKVQNDGSSWQEWQIEEEGLAGVPERI